jgi:hypothetical protein
MKGQEKLWSILNEKLETLRATNRLPQAIRVAETALEVAKRAFPDGQAPLATSFETISAEGPWDLGKSKTTGSASSLLFGAPARVLM